MKRSEKRLLQIQWLEELSRSSEYNYKQIVDHTNYFAMKNKIKPLSDSILRSFLNNKQGSVLHDKTLSLISDAFQHDLPSSLSDSYSMLNDNSDVSDYVKLCKQYVTDVCEAKGYTKNKLASLIGKGNSYFPLLFKNERVKGLSYQVLQDIENATGVKIPKAIEDEINLDKSTSDNYINIKSYLSLSASDEIIPLENSRKIISPLTDVTNIEAIELKGPTINPVTKDGAIYFYEKLEGNIINDNCIDNLCVIETEDDIKSVKFISKSSKEGLYRLQSIINNSVEHKAVKSASKIIYVAL